MGCSAFRFNEASKICELASGDFFKTALQDGNETISVLTQRKPCETLRHKAKSNLIDLKMESKLINFLFD
jgi:hypothetical protein